MKLPKLELYTKILIGLILGVGFGFAANRLGFAGFVADWIKPVGTAFVRLIGMVVVPLVFASLLVGTASLSDIRKLGRIGAKTLAFYLCTTAIAITIGLVLANLLQPGGALNEETQAELKAGAEAQGRTYEDADSERPGIRDVLLNIIPVNPIAAFVEGRMLQIIFFAIFSGICLTIIGRERAGPVIRFFEAVNDMIVQMVHLIMHLAPYGVFALIAAVVADFGLGVFYALLKYAAVVVIGLLLHVMGVYSLAVRIFSRLTIRRFFAGIRSAQLIAFSSSSSSATLPVTMECAEKNLGVPREVSSFALPLGATINMDGTSLYQGVSAVFIAQIYGIEMTVAEQLAIVLTATLASIGTAGTPGAGMITLAIVLKSAGLPLEGIGIIAGVERILDMCRSAVNITGDAACAVFVASSEKTPGK